MLQVAVLLLALFGCFITRWTIRTFTYWNDKGVPHLSFMEYMRTAYDIFTKPLYEVVQRNYERHGRVYGTYQGFVPTLVVGDPNLLRDICVRDFKSFADRSEDKITGNDIWDRMVLNSTGNEWISSRSTVTPSFTSSKLKGFVSKVLKVAEGVCSRLLEKGKDGGATEIQDTFSESAMDVMTSLVFSIDVNTHDNPNHPVVDSCNGLFGGQGGWKLVMLFAMPKVLKILKRIVEFPSKKSTDYMIQFTRFLVDQRIEEKKKFDDVLQILLEATLEAKDKDSVEITDAEIDEIASQCMLCIVAGTDAVKHTLTCAVYNLVMHPQYQERLIQEVDDTLKETDVTYDALKAMPFLEAVIYETLRMYTPDSFLTRVCTKETVVSGIRLKPGMGIEFPLRGVHYDSEFFPDPYQFNPERFLPENKPNMIPYTFLAFGEGPRNCVGTRMATVVIKAMLATIYRVMKFERCSETLDQLKFVPRSLLLEFQEPIKVQIIPRSTKKAQRAAANDKPQ
ncbi:cytochrome P450 3A41 isoform X1 [Ixodes scapularis]